MTCAQHWPLPRSARWRSPPPPALAATTRSIRCSTAARLRGTRRPARPVVLRALILADAETAPFQPVPPQPALDANAGSLHEPRHADVQGRHAQSRRRRRGSTRGCVSRSGSTTPRRSARSAKRRSSIPDCALCFWGEALILGPNINVPMMPEANAPALAALAKAVELAPKAPPRDRALIDALAKRYASDPKVERAALDAAYANAMGGRRRSSIRPTTRCRCCTPRR